MINTLTLEINDTTFQLRCSSNEFNEYLINEIQSYIFDNGIYVNGAFCYIFYRMGKRYIISTEWVVNYE